MDHDTEKQSLIVSEGNTVEDVALPYDTRPSSRRPSSQTSVLLILLVSLGANAFLLFNYICPSKGIPQPDKTAFAHLSNTQTLPWLSSSPYYGEDERIADEEWDGIDINNGSIALSDEYAAAMGLPVSQRFPWDETKGIYLLNGYHSMHCLKTIRSWVKDAAKDDGPHDGSHHILHCLDALRQDVLCYADDTPRYTGNQPPGRSGTDQVRQCKDWGQMEAWAQQHNACWRYLHDKDPGMDLVEEFKYCPEGSPYIEKMREYFGE